MKYKLGCILFGHTFHYSALGDEPKTYHHEFTDNCVKCGLSKEEIGIKK